ncbi:energy-coupling factor transporter transmembrane component T family protein [Halococcus salsus]|uniref:energy-coupling factor transporter transmembrane component T family protein n=1 Tax=Halococcus salsus TaxID=2162894 RepID=UPI001359355C|nr:energy-coupling factor transporter transmembrane component T [Halococcus salsus]
MTLAYEPGDSVAHRLDPRTKLAVQVGFAVAAFAHTTPRGLAVATGITAVALLAAATSPVEAVAEVRYALPFLVAGPAVAALTLGPPWVALSEAGGPALASYRVLLVLVVSTAYVRTTPVRDSRAAIQRTIPGRTGRLLGVGVALVFRFLPVLVADLKGARTAMRARLGTERSLVERMRIVAAAGVGRAFGRADRLGLALRARCFAWNPTLPVLQLSWLDGPALLVAGGLLVWAAL